MEEIKLTKDETIPNIGTSCFGCCILTDGRVAFTNYHNNVIRIFNTNGTAEVSFKTQIKPFDVIQVNGTTLAVSSADSGNGIHLIDTKKKQIINCLLKNHMIDGITARDENHLIYCERGLGVQMIRITDETITNIYKEDLPIGCYVTSFGDQVIHTNNITNTVTCHDLNGKKKWSFKDESVLRDPRGIATDRHGNVFVTGYHFDNIVIISIDRQKHTVVKSGLKDIWTLDYDKVSDTLLLAENPLVISGKAFVMKQN